MPEQIATLGITVDARGAVQQVNALDSSLNKLSATSAASTHGMSALGALQAEAAGHAGEHSLSINRLERNLASFSEHALGVNSTLGLLGTTMTKFSVGDVYTVGIMLGLAAVTAAWETLTRSAREAGKAQEDALKSASKMLLMKAAGPGGQNTLDLGQMSAMMIQLRAERASLAAADSGGGIARRLMLPGAMDNRARITEIDEQMKNLGEVMKATSAEIQKSITEEGMRTLGEAARKQAAAHAKVEAALRKQEEAVMRITELYARMYGNWPSSPTTAQRNADYRFSLGQAASAGAMYESTQAINRGILAELLPKFSMPNIGLNDGLTREQIKTREKMGIFIDDANKNTEKLSSVIWGSAIAGAGAIVSALNIGGGGKGSGLGGALGSTAGFALGMFASGGSPIGGAIGSTIGNIAGSLLGGLFDSHKKAINANTQALNANTLALYNQPSGFKAGYYSNNAANARMIYDAAAREALQRSRRGGTQPLVTGLAA